MEKETDKIIKHLEELEKEYYKYHNEVNDLLSEQEKVVNELIEKNRPVYEWVKNKTEFFFTHPTLRYKSRTGPILGYREEDDRLIVYDVDKNRIIITDIGEKYNEDKRMMTFQLITNGHFATAIQGLTYIEEMFENYVERIKNRVKELKKEIEMV